ncbi:hypothetical protein Aspvir_001667 [Aspergillus viridinutans]|uniref:Uncharacterized protein n=1 Tax=Aspergillus viridinutans TaxID=75553 RepID=A0A9P3BNP5_ASPVI|nr:uncharacterized protein Aspvir_001667 [Aspergillus viridinutans]GIJ99534.1 hypothetical protein Aspvir_001667 [Aspergillus viridinutans]
MEGNRESLKRSRADFKGHESTDDGSEYNGFDDSEEEEWWREDESEDLDCEQDIEEHEYTISGDTARTVKIRLFLTDDGMDQSRWMKNFVAKCTCNGAAVATALARYIQREGMRSEFWERMEEVSSDMCGVAFQVFDRYGTVKTKYKGHPVQKGTGVWGNELDYGPLFLIEELHVGALELCRKGLGQKMVSLLLNKAKQFRLEEKGDGKNADLFYGSREAFERAWTLHALVSPGILTADIESQLVGRSAEERLAIRARAQFGAILFWRACGFRRIGASHCFAFSFDSQHQSRTLAAASDFDPRRDDAEDLEDEELYETAPFTEVEKLKMERLRDALPLHHAALTLADDELKAFFMIHADDQIGWDRVTNSEATLLHLTACELKPLSTRWLLENVHHADSWKTARDIDGFTPLESLQEKLETMRTQKEVGISMVLNLSDHFRGYPDTALSCLSLLSERDTLGLNDECLRYGCTCGECLEGFLSARMRSSLVFQGETKYDLIRDDIDDGEFWIEDNHDILVHLDPDVRTNLETNKSLRRGFVNMFRIAVECLKANRVPTAENLEWCCNNRSEWPPHTKNYLRRAGTQMGCRAVLRYMFDAAKEEDEKAGNGECQLILKEEWSDLPTCRNDHEFEFVARACGYGGDDFW